MPAKAPSKVLITGATGFIGGTVLSNLLTSQRPSIQAVSYSVLIRSPSQESYFQSKNINTILFKDLEDVDTIKQAATEHDVVLNMATGFVTNAARALIEGLSERKRQHPDNNVFLIHTSGTSNLGDRPISKSYIEPRYQENRAFLDTEDIQIYLRTREAGEQYPQRTTDIVAIDTGLAENVPTYILMPSSIWGKGTGHFNKRSVQVPSLCRAAITARFSAVIGDGAGLGDHVHVVDLAQVYENILDTLLTGKKERLPSGKGGIYFCETGQHTWRVVAEGIAKAGKAKGLLDTAEVKEVGLDEGAKLFAGGVLEPKWVELGYALNSRSKTTKAKGLWEPKYSRQDFPNSFDDELEVALGEHD